MLAHIGNVIRGRQFQVVGSGVNRMQTQRHVVPRSFLDLPGSGDSVQRRAIRKIDEHFKPFTPHFNQHMYLSRGPEQLDCEVRRELFLPKPQFPGLDSYSTLFSASVIKTRSFGRVLFLGPNHRFFSNQIRVNVRLDFDSKNPRYEAVITNRHDNEDVSIEASYKFIVHDPTNKVRSVISGSFTLVVPANATRVLNGKPMSILTPGVLGYSDLYRVDIHSLVRATLLPS